MKYLIEEATLTGIADAVREKKGTTDLIQVSNLATEISNIQGGGTVEELTITSNGTYNPPTGIDGYAPVVVNVPQDGGPPESALHMTGDITDKFSNDGWNWFIEMYGKQITMDNITHAERCFANCSTLKSIPIDSINFKNTDNSVNLNNMFSNCYELMEAPKITIAYSYYAPYMEGMFRDCRKLRELPYDYFTSMSNKWDTMNSNSSNGNKDYMFENCWSLRAHPDMTCLEQIDRDTIYQYVLSHCYSLNEVINYPVAPGELTSNGFRELVNYCLRLKNMTFRTNEDGSPVVANWTNQTIDLTAYIGYLPNSYFISDIIGYNSGITKDKQVKDNATYQTLKDDPDWFSCDINYSRYNHNSAVNTINSLPDTSAYLATAGGTNTIKFKGQSGASTDGGAINTLTEEEIAVATAKGWTVSLV